MWNSRNYCIWNPHGHSIIPCGIWPFHHHSIWNPGGMEIPKWVGSQLKHIPYEVVDSMWIPCGIRGESKNLQGDPLSMILYVIYNADLLEIPGDNEHEKSLGYVDNIALVATGKDFMETGRQLQHMMTKEDGGLQWSKEHNSRFEVSKSVVLHATWRMQADPRDPRKRIPLDRTPLRIASQLIQEVSNFKYLGVQIDTQLNWKEQTQRATANATKWILQFRRLTRPTTGVSSKLMRQLFLAVALPKITYSIDVWFSPLHKPVSATKNAGSIGSLRSL